MDERVGDALPVCQVIGGQRGFAEKGGRVYQDSNRAKVSLSMGNHIRHLCGIRNVGVQRERAHSKRLGLRRSGGSRLC